MNQFEKTISKYNNLFLILKGICLFICSCLYFLEFFFYYVYLSPVDPGFLQNPIADLNSVLALCSIKALSIFLFMYVLKKLKEKGLGIKIYIILMTILATLTYLPVISFNYTKIELLRVFIPIIVNILIITYLLKDLIKLKKINIDNVK